MSKLNGRVFGVVAISIDFAGRVEFKIIKLFYEEVDAERFLKQYSGSQPDEKAWEIHEVEAPE